MGTATVLQVYAPTAAETDNEMDKFYGELQQQLNNIPQKSVRILMGDFNAKVGSESKSDAGNSGAIGAFGLGIANERGNRLKQFCSVNDMVITNTCFKQTRINRLWTWESPDGHTHNQIDFIIVGKKWRSSVLNSRVFPGADIGSDHQLVIANFRLKLKKREAWKSARKFDIGKLKNSTTAGLYESHFAEILERNPEGEVHRNHDIEQVWAKIKLGYNETSKEILGFAKRKRQKDWISEETYKLVDERKSLKTCKSGNAVIAKHYNFLCREVRRRCKQDKDSYINDLCKEVEEAHMEKKSRKVYESIRKIQNKKTSTPNVIKNKNGVILSDPKEVQALPVVNVEDVKEHNTTIYDHYMMHYKLW